MGRRRGAEIGLLISVLVGGCTVAIPPSGPPSLQSPAPSVATRSPASPSIAPSMPVASRPGGTPEPTPPADLPTTFSASGLGVGITIQLQRSPMPAGEPSWIDTTATNITTHDVTWFHDGCAIAVGIAGELTEVDWRPGAPPSGPGKVFKTRLLDSEIRQPAYILFGPAEWIDAGSVGCSDVGITDTIKPGHSVTQRVWWNGMVSLRLGPPPTGPVALRIQAGYFWPTGPEPADITAQQVRFTAGSWISNGRDPSWLDPPEVVDAALEDPAFASSIATADLGNGIVEILWFDLDRGVWQVGTLDYGSHRLHLLLVDPATGDVLETVDRAWQPAADGYP